MNNKKLTGKQDKFCTCVAKGMTQSDAYREAYNTENMKDKCIHEEACKLASSPKISQRIEYVRENLINYTMEKHMQELDEAKMMAHQLENVQGVIKVTELKGKAKGHYVTKTEVKDTSEHENWLDKLQ